jgi:hypothetical protein
MNKRHREDSRCGSFAVITPHVDHIPQDFNYPYSHHSSLANLLGEDPEQ